MSDDPFAHLIPPLRKLVDKRRVRDEKKAAAEAAEKEFRAQEDAVHAAMKTMGKQPHVTLDLGDGYGTWRFQRRETVYGKVYDHEAAVASAKEAGRFDELVMPASHVKFRGKALNDFVKEAREHGQELPPGFEPDVRTGITMTNKNK